MSDLTDLPDTRHLMNMLKDSVPKSDLRKLRDDMSNSIGPVYNDKTRVWLKRIDELLRGE